MYDDDRTETTRDFLDNMAAFLVAFLPWVGAAVALLVINATR